MLAELSDEQIVEATLRGNPDVFGEIVKRWERKIFALCFGMLNREEDARDAMQDTFILAYKNLANFRSESKFSSWLHRIAVNQCLSKHRWRKARSESFLDDESQVWQFAAPDDSPLAAFEEKQTNESIYRAVSSLPEELRQIVIMKEFEELTFQQISEALGVPLSTVKSRLYTALKQLRLKLESKQIING